MAWVAATLKTYPELAIFLSLAVGFWLGPKKLGGFSLGNVTATLLMAVLVGQLNIAVPGPIKSAFFLIFLFAVGYGVGPQFFAGLSKDGPRQVGFALIVLAFCLLGAVMRGRRRFLNIVTLLVLAAIFFSTTGCGGKFDPFTSTVTVTATSGTLQHTSSIDLSVK